MLLWVLTFQVYSNIICPNGLSLDSPTSQVLPFSPSLLLQGTYQPYYLGICVHCPLSPAKCKLYVGSYLHLSFSLDSIPRISQLFHKELFNYWVNKGSIWLPYGAWGEKQVSSYKVRLRLYRLSSAILIYLGFHSCELRLSACSSLCMDSGSRLTPIG